MSNSIENGSFLAAKMRFYHSAMQDTNFSFTSLVDFFRNSHSQNINLARNYVVFLRKMIEGTENKMDEEM